jgi:hypothetical protein
MITKVSSILTHINETVRIYLYIERDVYKESTTRTIISARGCGSTCADDSPGCYILDTRGGDGGVCTKMNSRKSDVLGGFFNRGVAVWQHRRKTRLRYSPWRGRNPQSSRESRRSPRT